MGKSPQSSTLEQLLLSSTPSQRRAVEEILAGKSLWAPQSSPQWLAYLSEADALFSGGPAGGGKSDLLVGLAVTGHLKSIIFRREFSQLTGASGLIERSHELLDNIARYNGQEHVWRDIPGGRQFEFGGVQYEDDKKRYQGRAHDLKAFDEVTEFTESQYRFLTGWARSTEPGQRVRVMATGNPPTHAEGQWVIEYWGPWLDDKYPNPARPGELRWFAVLDGKDVEVDGPETFDYNGEAITPKSRTFIPAALADNAYLRDTDYGAVLQGLPEPLRSQLLYGDFSVGLDDDPWQVIPTEWVRLAFQRYEEREPPGEDEPLSGVGVDVARGGKDKTAVQRRFGNWFPPVKSWPGKETPDGPTVAQLTIQEMGAGRATIYVDVIGVGGAVVDALTGKGLPVVGVNFAGASDYRDKTGLLKMRNKRAEAYWRTREALDPNTGDDLAIAPSNQLLADLTAPRYRPTASGIQVELKEEIVKRIGRSPDEGDAFVLSLFQNDHWYIF